MTVSVVREEESQKIRLIPPEDEPRTVVDEDALRLQAIAVLHGLSSILAARLILLLAVLIGGALGGLAAWNGSAGSIISAAIFNVTVLIPLVALSARKG